MDTQSVKGLIADIGATNARFALADSVGIYHPHTLQCAEFTSLSQAAAHYLKHIGLSYHPDHAVLAVAAPIEKDHVSFTNNPWSFSIPDIKKEMKLSSLHVLNDFEAIACAISDLKPEDIVQIGGGHPEHDKPIAVIGPGTGLGVAGLFWDGKKYIPNPCEGGHVTMAARTQREFDIFTALRYKYSYISVERVCSGKGLVNIYNAIRILDGYVALADRSAEEISAAACAGTCPVCVESLSLMLRFLGRIAGDLALTLNAYGGVYIAGGIPTKLGNFFFQSDFRPEFESKGSYGRFLREIPTYLITRPNIAFLGLKKILAERR
ncbi:MAG: glucokinase [Alphaproteobacteria bacterium]|nr:glucokinase [Alphaproteobacteria bacterium]